MQGPRAENMPRAPWSVNPALPRNDAKFPIRKRRPDFQTILRKVKILLQPVSRLDQLNCKGTIGQCECVMLNFENGAFFGLYIRD